MRLTYCRESCYVRYYYTHGRVVITCRKACACEHVPSYTVMRNTAHSTNSTSVGSPATQRRSLLVLLIRAVFVDVIAIGVAVAKTRG